MLESRADLSRVWRWAEVPVAWQLDALAKWLRMPAKPNTEAGIAAWSQQLNDDWFRCAVVGGRSSLTMDPAATSASAASAPACTSVLQAAAVNFAMLSLITCTRHIRVACQFGIHHITHELMQAFCTACTAAVACQRGGPLEARVGVLLQAVSCLMQL